MKRELKQHELIEYIETCIDAHQGFLQAAEEQNSPAWAAREEEWIRQLAAAAVVIEGEGTASVMVEVEEVPDG